MRVRGPFSSRVRRYVPRIPPEVWRAIGKHGTERCKVAYAAYTAGDYTQASDAVEAGRWLASRLP